MKIDPRRWKFGGGVAGIVGVAALAVVLVLVFMMVPRADVAARVNGERILAEDVAEVQARYMLYGMSISHDQALEQLINERLLLQEATKGGYLPTLEDAEFELHTQLAMMGMTKDDLEAQLALHDVSYEEYLDGFGRDMAIQDYLEDTIEITEEEAIARYDEYAEMYGDSLPPFDQVKQQIVGELQQEALPSLIERLREEASIKYG